MTEKEQGKTTSKIAGEINAEMMKTTRATQSLTDRMVQEIESLRQQLAAMTLERNEWKEAHDVVVANCKLSDEQHHKGMEGYAAELAAARAEIERLKRKDFREMHEMLRAMQAGELTVSRGLEILNIWWAGNWNDNMLPPVRQDLIEENAMPVEIIDRLNQQLATYKSELDEFRKHAKAGFERQLADQKQLAAALATCKLKDEALNDAIEEIDSLSGRDNSCDPKSSTEDFEKALAIQPDDSALKTWLGEPIGEVKKHTGSLKDMAIIVWSGEQPAEGTKLYSPKGLK